MKRLKSLGFFLLVFSSIFLIQCTTDPIPGIPGDDGADGMDGMDGVNGTTECAACHNVSTSEAVHASFLYSKHYENETISRGGSSSCARCHSGNGFVDYIDQGSMNDYTPSQAVLDSPEKISCTTCHDMHTSFDFETDGFDYALRSLKGVNLITDEGYTIDFNGTSNMCAKCHQPRRSPESEIVPVDGLVEVGRRFGPHHGPQATMLEGIQGVELVGSLEYPAIGEAGHRTGSSCTSCHMGEPSGINGNHTWIPTTEACTQCHGDTAPGPVTGLEEGMETLFALLEEKGVLEKDEEGEVGIVSGVYPTLTAEATWNYLLIVEDQSNGVHNPNYAKALIQNSIDALSAD